MSQDTTFSDELEHWLREAPTHTLGSLSHLFAEKSFATTILLLMFVPAMPLPTGGITHVFTHFRLELTVVRAVVPVETSLNLWAEPDRCRWVARRQLHAQALPSVMRKLIAHGMRES